MADISFEDEIIERVRKLDSEKQRKVLDYVRDLEQPKGEPGWKLAEHARSLGFSHEDLEEMKRAIEEDCETIDEDEWDNTTFPS